MGIEQSRRDDLETVCHVFVYFLCSGLPWQNARLNSKQKKHDAVKEIKASISPEALCKGLPEEFATYLNYCRSLGFEETPDYEYLQTLFRGLFVREKFKYDLVFDWSLTNDMTDCMASVRSCSVDHSPRQGELH